MLDSLKLISRKISVAEIIQKLDKVGNTDFMAFWSHNST